MAKRRRKNWDRVRPGESKKHTPHIVAARRLKPEWTDTIRIENESVPVFGVRFADEKRFGKLVKEIDDGSVHYYVYRDTRVIPHNYAKPDTNFLARRGKRPDKT